jgi:exodeoxyribonuclease V gamma subunit
MLPDIASASGAIEAVFGTVPENRYIPWQLTGVASPEENSLWRAFTSIVPALARTINSSELY